MIAAELRLGNLVNTIVSDKPSIVTFIKSQKVKDGYYQSIELDEQEIYIPQHICGIPLTADILERAGFEFYNQQVDGMIIYSNDKSTLEGYPEGSTNVITEENGKFYYGIVSDGAYTTYHVEIPFVHTLQNLYFALHKEELTINLLSESVK